MKLLILSVALILGLFEPCNAQFGGLSRWFNKEVVPTIKGERPLKIDPTRVRVSQNGKDILRASTTGNGSVYVDFGIAKIQTNNLGKELIRTAAIFSGNTAVMSEVAFDQFKQVYKKQLQAAQDANLIKVSKEAPPAPIVQQPEVSQGKSVIIYNHTSATINYALNDKFYTLESNKGYEHSSVSGEFFLQYDSDYSDDTSIARYYLTGKEYSLYLYDGMPKISIHRYPTE